jgi:alcohol dehydrogenase class IV
MTVHQFSFPTLIHFGPGVRRQVPDYLRRMAVKRPLIVTDKGLAPMKITTDFVADLHGGELAPHVFAGVWGNPTAAQVKAGVDAFRAHQADAVIGFGGGAALDVAKAVALMAVHEGDVLDYAWDKPNARKPSAPLPHFIALPTTAGTGSEVGRSAVISDDATHVKKIVFAPELLAKAVFADPQLTLGLPPAMTAATGMDALAHNVESYLSPAYHPLCDGIALEGTRIAAHALRAAVADGTDLRARGDMLMASMMGAIAFQKDLGAVHSCGHALGTVLGLHHGLAIGIMFDHVMRFNAEAANERFAELARVTGAGRTAAEFVNWLTQLKAEIGIPAKLSEVGVKPEHLTRLVELALNDTCHRTNPRPCQRDDFEALFRAAM